MNCRRFDESCRATERILNEARDRIDPSQFQSGKLLTSRDAAFKRRAQPACAALDRALTAARLDDPAGGGRAGTLGAAAKAYAGAAAALAELPPPTDRREEFGSMLRAYRTLARAYEAAAAAARRGDRAEVARITAKAQITAALAQGTAETIGIRCRAVV